MSAKIYYLRRPYRRRSVPATASVRGVARPSSRPHAGGFTLLLFLTIPLAFLYLSEAAHVARHDTMYAVLLAAVWSLYFLHPPLLRTRIGPLLIGAGRLLVLSAGVGFFGGIYWLILAHP